LFGVKLIKNRIFDLFKNKKTMIRIPYGISNYETLVGEGYIYIDRTNFIELIEERYRYIFFLRPRKFGKSLFLSMLDYYYNIKYKDDFERLFGQFYIGRKPTKMANQYLILRLDFSQIETSSFEKTYDGFTTNVRFGAENFYGRYPQFFNEADIERVRKYDNPSAIIQDVINQVELKTSYKIYLLIDEYDHFANEILSFRYNEFMEMVGQNGFVRKFYETIKVGTQKAVIDRLFVTGVSPITLDSLTSGFNIATNISLRPELNELMGFVETEVVDILKGVGVANVDLDHVLGEMREWYNGYKFSVDAENRVYNSNMVLYFAREFLYNKKYPTELLDPNIASDYNKIRKSFKIKGREKENLVHLDKLVKTGTLKSELVQSFDLEKRFDTADFISLLFYQGIITIWKNDLDNIIFKMPNYVIKQLYFQYFHKVILEQSELDEEGINVKDKINQLAKFNDFVPLVRYAEEVLQELSLRDKMNFDEKHVKTIFTSAFYTSKVYHIHNEFEVKKSKTEKGYVDLLLTKRPPFEPKFQFVIEFKYLKKESAHKAETVKQQAIKQLQAYLEHDERLQKLEELKAYVIVFVGNKGEIVEL
jgi:hypothetical protein